MCPAAMAARAAAPSIISMLCVGTSVMRDGRPGAWPERPARCNSRATPFGEPICSTRSTGRKSTPRSRLDVHTTAFSAPLFRPSSTHSRTSRSSEPWCSAISPAQSGRACNIAWYQISDCERVLVKTSVVLLAAISSITCGSMVSPRWPPHGKRSARPGSSESTSNLLGTSPCTSTASTPATPPPSPPPSPPSPPSPPAPPNSVSIASCRLPSVADMPQTHRPAFQRRSRASASCTCTPRLLPSSSCHSSTTTRRRLPSTSLASARASSNDRLSGVVTSTVGRRLFCAVRSAEPVSPLREPTLQPGCKTSSGACSERKVSAASARIGVSHSTVSRGGLLARAFGAKACNAPSQTA